MRYFAFLILSVNLFSCSTSEEEHSLKDDFDKLENIFSTANWKIIDRADTSYRYFSRLGNLNYMVYDFKLKEGDSTITALNRINVIDKKIKWILSGDTLELITVDSATAIWSSLHNKKELYTFKKKSDSNITVELPGDKKLSMSRTVSLATFLVRSKYDYIHNTHTVDSPLVKPRGKPLSN